MEKFTTLRAIAAPLPRENIDTDLIWPGTSRGSLRKGDQAMNMFGTLRFDKDGNERPEFVLNREPYRNAKILIAGDNFGCGSSREMAVWALYDWGLRCIIAPSFGDIFYNNACINGLLPVKLPVEVVRHLTELAENPAIGEFTVSLEALTVTAPDGSTYPFTLGAYHRTLMLEGLDEIGFTLKQLPAIEAFERRYRQARPWA
jgi:3-isopropylmalate/(R)-2-methylmalate dehydratase small subunit